MLPWAEMLRTGLQLGLTPASFWACSLKEWRWLMRANAPFAREAFDQLATQFPDMKEGSDGHV